MQYKYFFPWIPILPEVNDNPCGMTNPEHELMQLIKNHPEQNREKLVCNSLLQKAAKYKAKRMGELQYVGHVLDGVGPNYLIEQFGYKLPTWYPSARHSNSIESVAGGPQTPQIMLDNFLNSPGHRRHILGNGVYSDQIFIGIGTYTYTVNNYQHWWWCVITAPPI